MDREVGRAGRHRRHRERPATVAHERAQRLDSPRHSESNPGALRFPLEVGKSWRYRSDWTFKPKGSKGSSDVEVAVVGYERIRVPAGEFEAFKLELASTLSGASPIGSRYDGRTTATYWYAPSARAIVKWVGRNPYLGPSTVELVAFERSR